MSNPNTVRIAAAVEGPTDAIVLEAVLNAHRIRVPDSAAGGIGSIRLRVKPNRNRMGRVYRWCRQSAAEGGGSVSGSSVLSNHDLLIIQVDADVADKTYSRSIRQGCRAPPGLERSFGDTV